MPEGQIYSNQFWCDMTYLMGRNCHLMTARVAQSFNFCDALQVKNDAPTTAAGWSPDHALMTRGDSWKLTYMSLCE